MQVLVQGGVPVGPRAASDLRREISLTRSGPHVDSPLKKCASIDLHNENTAARPWSAPENASHVQHMTQ